MGTLLEESRVFWNDLFQSQLDSGMDGIESLFHMADFFAKRFKENSPRLRGLAVLIFGAADPGNKTLHQQALNNQRSTRAAFRKIIDRHMAAQPGLFDYDADGMAALINGMFRGFIYQWMTDPHSMKIDIMFKEFKRVAPQLLGAPLPNSGGSRRLKRR
jgi:hypothetical protein